MVQGPLTAYWLARGRGVVDTGKRGDGSVTLPAPVLLEAFDSLTGFSFNGAFLNAAIDTAVKAQGSGRLTGEGNGLSSPSMQATKTVGSYDLSQMGVIAYPLWLPERGQNNVQAVFIRGGTSYFSPNDFLSGVPYGMMWRCFDMSEIAGFPTGAVSTDFRLQITQNAPYDTKIGIDSLVANAKGRTEVIIGFDDGFRSQYDLAFPYMQSKGLVGTLYTPWANVLDSRQSNKQITAEVQAMSAAGWAVCLDGTADDTTMTSKADPATAVSGLLAGRDWLASKNLPAEGGFHFCYPNGYYCSVPGTEGGTGFAYVQVSSAAFSGNTITFTSGAVTVANGMVVDGYGVPPGTVVVSGGGAGVTSVVVNNSLPTQSGKAISLADKSGAFTYPALPNALATAGFKTGRTTLQDNMYVRFGFGDMALLSRARSTSAATLATLQPFIDRAILRGESVEFYIHDINATGGSINMKDTDFYAVIDYIAANRDAGLLDVVTKPQWYARHANAATPF